MAKPCLYHVAMCCAVQAAGGLGSSTPAKQGSAKKDDGKGKKRVREEGEEAKAEGEEGADEVSMVCVRACVQGVVRVGVLPFVVAIHAPWVLFYTEALVDTMCFVVRHQPPAPIAPSAFRWPGPCWLPALAAALLNLTNICIPPHNVTRYPVFPADEATPAQACLPCCCCCCC